MATTVASRAYTYEQYLELARDSNVKLEYLAGVIYAMAGGTPAHALRIANLVAMFNRQLGARRCNVYASDLHVRVLATGLATYPDLTVVCDRAEYDPASALTITNPTVLVEVLSPSTADYDRGEKLDHYKRIPSLRDVVLVGNDPRELEIWHRDDAGWSVARFTSGTVELASVGVTLDLDGIYRDALA